MDIRPLSGVTQQSGSPSREAAQEVTQPDSVTVGEAKKSQQIPPALISEIMAPKQDPLMSDEYHWNPGVEKRIDEFIEKVKAGEVKNPTAVFDADGTIWRDDIGESFLRWLIKNRKLKDVDYSKDIYGEYEKMLQQDVGAAYAFSTSIMKGINEQDLQDWSTRFFPEHFSGNVFPKQKELFRRLQDAGVDVWIVTASNHWIVEGAAPHMGINADHVVGMRVEVENGVLTDKVIPPITYRQGKVDAIEKYIGKKVDFAAGNSMTDYEMLKSAKEMSLVINPRDAGPPDDNLMHLAKSNDWAIQKWA